MRFVFHTNSVSPHQIPLAHELVACLGADNYRYIYSAPQTNERKSLGWNLANEDWIISEEENSELCRQMMETCDILLSGLRDVELFERRSRNGLTSLYVSERWFKPKIGALRMLLPSYARMVKSFVRWAKDSPRTRILAIGPWARTDFLRIGIPEERIVDWGYFVEPTRHPESRSSLKHSQKLRLLWCGRLLDWKRTIDIVRAVRLIEKDHNAQVELTVIGSGPMRAEVTTAARGLPVRFMSPQPIERIREIMRMHDTLVMTSNAYEGWGAVVSEALEEGVDVIGTFEAGASAALLPSERLYHAGDVNALLCLIKKEIKGLLPSCSIGEWTAKKAAGRLMSLIGQI